MLFAIKCKINRSQKQQVLFKTNRRFYSRIFQKSGTKNTWIQKTVHCWTGTCLRIKNASSWRFIEVNLLKTLENDTVLFLIPAVFVNFLPNFSNAKPPWPKRQKTRKKPNARKITTNLVNLSSRNLTKRESLMKAMWN